MANIPGELRYTREHTWARIDAERARIGITDYAQGQLGEVVAVQLPRVGARTALMKPFGAVESIKSISDLAAPMSGEVVETNAELSRQPDLVNRDPYGGGWMVVIRLAAPAEADRLLTAEEYRYLVEMSSA